MCQWHVCLLVHLFFWCAVKTPTSRGDSRSRTRANILDGEHKPVASGRKYVGPGLLQEETAWVSGPQQGKDFTKCGENDSKRGVPTFGARCWPSCFVVCNVCIFPCVGFWNPQAGMDLSIYMVILHEPCQCTNLRIWKAPWMLLLSFIVSFDSMRLLAHSCAGPSSGRLSMTEHLGQLMLHGGRTQANFTAGNVL